MTEEKAKVVTAVWRMYLNAALAIKQQGGFEEKFLKEHPLKEGGDRLWCGLEDHPFSRALKVELFYFLHQ